jgi:hypothetical protein
MEPEGGIFLISTKTRGLSIVAESVAGFLVITMINGRSMATGKRAKLFKS